MAALRALKFQRFGVIVLRSSSRCDSSVASDTRIWYLHSCMLATYADIRAEQITLSNWYYITSPHE